MKDDYKVVKHNSLVNAKGKYAYSINQLKLVSHLIAHIKPTDTNFEMRGASLIELGFVGDENKNHTWFKEEFLKLLEMPFLIPGTKKWVNWFSCLEYDCGVINYAFDERLKPYLLELKENFTSYHLNNVLSLKTNYALLTFEILAQARNLGYRNIKIKEFRELLNIPEGYRNNDINVMLKKVQKEIRERTNMQFDFSMKKMGKKFDSINFVIKNNKKINDISFDN